MTTLVSIPNDSQWETSIAAFREKLAVYRQETAASIEANRKQAEKRKQCRVFETSPQIPSVA